MVHLTLNEEELVLLKNYLETELWIHQQVFGLEENKYATDKFQTNMYLLKKILKAFENEKHS